MILSYVSEVGYAKFYPRYVDESGCGARTSQLPMGAQTLVVNPDGGLAAGFWPVADLRLQLGCGAFDLYSLLDEPTCDQGTGMGSSWFLFFLLSCAKW